MVGSLDFPQLLLVLRETEYEIPAGIRFLGHDCRHVQNVGLVKHRPGLPTLNLRVARSKCCLLINASFNTLVAHKRGSNLAHGFECNGIKGTRNKEVSHHRLIVRKRSDSKGFGGMGATYAREVVLI